MPPRLALRLAQPIQQTPSISISSFLVPFLHNHARMASILNQLSDNPGAYNKRIRRGQGPSAGKGKTSGRGHKGQGQHSKVPKGFTGGQTKEEIAHGKFGFVNVHSTEMAPINLDRIQDWIDQGRLDPTQPITLKELHSSRCIHQMKDGVKLLGDGANQLKTPITIIVSRASESAIAAVEKLGGTVVTRFYTPNALRRIRAGEMHPYISLRWDPLAISETLSSSSSSSSSSSFSSTSSPESPPFTAIIDRLHPTSSSPYDLTLPTHRVTGLGYKYRLPDPTSRKDIEYYRDATKRGYLSHTVGKDETASLYFKRPLSEEEIGNLKKKSGVSVEAKRREENKLW